jgi:hypothetical protein
MTVTNMAKGTKSVFVVNSNVALSCLAFSIPELLSCLICMHVIEFYYLNSIMIWLL